MDEGNSRQFGSTTGPSSQQHRSPTQQPHHLAHARQLAVFEQFLAHGRTQVAHAVDSCETGFENHIAGVAIAHSPSPKIHNAIPCRSNTRQHDHHDFQSRRSPHGRLPAVAGGRRNYLPLLTQWHTNWITKQLPAPRVSHQNVQAMRLGSGNKGEKVSSTSARSV